MFVEPAANAPVLQLIVQPAREQPVGMTMADEAGMEFKSTIKQ
jgi:hypothetical protein